MRLISNTILSASEAQEIQKECDFDREELAALSFFEELDDLEFEEDTIPEHRRWMAYSEYIKADLYQDFCTEDYFMLKQCAE